MPEALAQHAMHPQLQPAARSVTPLQLVGLLRHVGLLRRPRRPAVAAALEPSMPETLAVALAHRRMQATRHLQPTVQLVARSTCL